MRVALALAHAHESYFGVLHMEALICEFSVKEGSALLYTVLVDVTTLGVHALDDAVELGAYVAHFLTAGIGVLTIAKLHEVRAGLGSEFGKEFNNYLLDCTVNVHIEVNIVAPWGVLNDLLLCIVCALLVDQIGGVREPELVEGPLKESLSIANVNVIVIVDYGAASLVVEEWALLFDLELVEVLLPLGLEELVHGEIHLLGVSFLDVLQC